MIVGLLGPNLATAAENFSLERLRSTVTSAELSAHVQFLADDMLEGRETGSRGSHAAARYLEERLKEYGLEPAGIGEDFKQPFPGNAQNILAILPGHDPNLKQEYILVGAHYDHVGYGNRRNSYGPIGYIHNGADDNASGVATLLETIDALVSAGYQPRRSILFAFWDGEEKGLLGSKHWLRNPSVPISAVKLAWNIDMVGRLQEGRILVMGSRAGVGMRQLLSTYNLQDGDWLDLNWDYKDNSDHWTFYQAGIPALCMHTGLHDDYHRPTDDVEHLNLNGMRRVTQYLVEQLAKQADAETLPQFRPQARHETEATHQRLQAELPPLAPRFDFQWKFDRRPEPHVLVTNVPRGSSSAAAGLLPGDRIVSVNSLPVVSKSLLPAVALRADSELLLTVERQEPSGLVELDVPLAGGPVRLGLSWRDDAAEPNAVYVTRVVPHSPAKNAGLTVQDRIYALNGRPIAGQADFLAKVRELLATDAEALSLQVETNGRIREVEISLKLPDTAEHDSSL